MAYPNLDFEVLEWHNDHVIKLRVFGTDQDGGRLTMSDGANR